MKNRLEVPTEWKKIKLKFIASISFSSVDRHNGDDFVKVKICHYPDAYKNEKIDVETQISSGYCSVKQLQDFALTKGRVVITKDSETADDIGVPVLIDETIVNGVIGYHLAIIDTESKKYSPDFLFRVIQSEYVRTYFELNSNGVTRFGLGKPAIQNLEVPYPPLPEQTKIANYLDHKTGIIDQLIADKERLVALLQEQRQATINEAVTGGLDADGNIRQKPDSLPAKGWKDSGIEWLGAVPEDWEVVPVKYVSEVKGRIGFRGYTSSDLVSEGEGALTLGATHITSEGNIMLDKATYISWDKYEESPEIKLQTGDVLIVQRGSTCGKTGIIREAIGPATINPSLVVLKDVNCNNEYLFYGIKSNLNELVNLTNSAAIPMLSQEQIGNLRLCMPPSNVQEEIVNKLRSIDHDFEQLLELNLSMIQNLKSYRQSLISEAVTGKIDLREWDEVE